MAKPPFIVIPYEPASVTEYNQLASRPASHLGEFLFPGMVWRTNAPQAFLNVAIDLGSAKPIDFFAMLGMRSPTVVSGNAVLGSTLGTFDQYAGPSISMPETSTPAPADGLGQWMHILGAPITSRYPSALIYSVLPEFGASFFVVGQRITFERFAEHDWEVGGDDTSQVAFTRGGVPDIAEGVFQRTLSFTLKWVSEAEYFEKVAPLDALVGRRKPVLICFDEEAGARRQALTYFGLLRENPRTKRANARAFERRFEILSLI